MTESEQERAVDELAEQVKVVERAAVRRGMPIEAVALTAVAAELRKLREALSSSPK
ncbi:MAG: hypothetical protein OXG27_00830 [Chloroflexi bacterium]|nr:hypothetical protein [Chloroflexota bacterium]